MVCDDWADLTLVKARLDAGADPDGLGTDPDRLGTDPDRLDEDNDTDEDREGADRGVGTPLHQAAAHGSGPVVAALARRAADVDARDGDGCTPLWHAVCRGRADVAAALLASGADPWRSLIHSGSPARAPPTGPAPWPTPVPPPASPSPTPPPVTGQPRRWVPMER
ncbi:hypothetical protein CD790_17095 [Streptomyces sp. SAJ15]|nr:hypothetical protein CD790_17095 [Streptomyces sp. SAJ15]